MDRSEYMQPGECRLDIELADLTSPLTVPSTVADTENFLTSYSDLAKHFNGKKTVSDEVVLSLYAQTFRHPVALPQRDSSVP